MISRLSRIASAGELKLRRRNIAREKISDLRERHPRTHRLGYRPKVGTYAVLTPQVYGFPLPINRTSRIVGYGGIPSGKDRPAKHGCFRSRESRQCLLASQAVHV